MYISMIRHPVLSCRMILLGWDFIQQDLKI